MMTRREALELIALALFVFACGYVAGCSDQQAARVARAAPVPKRGPVEPPALTADLMAGEWEYLWGEYKDGRIYFDRDGSYGAYHVPGSTTWYHGTWTVTGNTLTIVERGFDIETGRTWDGGTYLFDFDKSRVPNLVGVSNGSTPVKLTKPQR